MSPDPPRALLLERPALFRCLAELVKGAVLQVVAAFSLAVAVGLWTGTGNNESPEAATLVLAGLALGYAFWVKGLVKPARLAAHELEALWHVGGMLLVIVAGTPFLPSFRLWIFALGLGAWAVFALPPALWGLFARRARRLKAQGWSEDPPPSLQELRPWLLGWGVAALALVAVVAASTRL